MEGMAEAYDYFGATLATADFNRDGRDDLAIGAYGENSYLGAVNVMFGSSTGLTTVRNGLLMIGYQGLQGSNIGTPDFGTLGTFNWYW